jgi:hypothetical protein
MSETFSLHNVDEFDMWRHVLVRGQKSQVDRFLDRVGSRFRALGWSRDVEYEGL